MKPLLSGPKLENVQEISDQFLKNKAMIVVKDHIEISDAILALFNDRDRCIKMTQDASKIIEKNKGSKEKILKLIRPLLSLH